MMIKYLLLKIIASVTKSHQLTRLSVPVKKITAQHGNDVSTTLHKII